MDFAAPIHPNRRARWQLLARKLRDDPGLLQIALENLDRWEKSDRLGYPAMLQRWREIVEQALASPQGLDRLLDLVTAEDDDSLTLKSCSPLAGILTRDERRALPVPWAH